MTSPSQEYLHVPYGRLVVRAILAVVALLACITVLFILEQRRTQSETSAILSAFFSNRLLSDVKDQGEGHEIQVVLLREAQNPWETDGLQQSLLFDRRSSFSQSSPATRASFFLSNAFPTNIQAELHLSRGLQPFFISRRELEEPKPIDFQARFPNNLGYFVVSHAGLNPSKTEAILYAAQFCPGLCGGGAYFLMRKVNGNWSVVDQHVVWIS